MQLPLLPDIVVLFCLSIGVLLVCHRVRLPAIVGFLITGVLCGPSALGLVSAVHEVELMAEIGVVLLMFTIGMELSGDELSRLRKPVFIGGTAQVGLTVAVFAGIALLHGQTLSEGILFGFLAALSSTAIVLSLLQQRAQTESPQGRIALSVLIFQDIAIVPMMLAIPLLAGTITADAKSLALSVGRTVAVLGGLVLLARYVVPPLMERVVRTRSRELLLLTTLGLCLAVALLTSSMGLSLSLGAFLAGLLLAESEYSLSVIEGVLPFRDVFTSLFFISVGMLLDVGFLFDNLGAVLAVAAALVVLKAAIATPAILLLGYPLRTCIIAALALAQIGEFSFVLARSGLEHGLLGKDAYQMFLAASIITMTLTPGLLAVAPRFARYVSTLLKSHETFDEAHGAALHDHLIVVGFGVGGKHLARVAREAGIAYTILEMNPDTVARYHGKEPIHHGDATHPLVLEHLGVRQARILAVVISDPAAVRGVTAAARALNPALHIVVRTRFLGEVTALRDLGANEVVPEEFETSIEVFSRVLTHYLVPRQTIDGFIDRIRAENYDMLRSHDLPGSTLAALEGGLPGVAVEAYTVEAGASIAGRTLLESDLRQRHGVTVVAIRRGETTLASPDGSMALLPGDVAYVFGEPTALHDAAALFSKATGDAPFAERVPSSVSETAA
ncbi:cation:proton antiporter domain-containing protein [Nitratidesulfovibrio vulgaris]|uniref:Glutathione-regulated potassium-efflux system protein KefB, putative n=1 Tax=Nitratidesulfovibrio vulgaris (strain ATCC 29579 / DSM 644 / CCUG 34227 / NCIMB 8303 / VKM B-1760 / Hildenborough) TaxID=882 RepID=Q729P8_NITV2|nr:cation:proton antiporter [Nitratidesulfovibrio vulgaris]AAS96775.1 glutathione-regulated potassium-efflux system protein KefB, putative [Nitratidesulfovibrio vulgaris str. Hildenborough]ADP87278.1 sodium/hydrogen exchanger [Nitratidesulfovibrio vulgaris RCH1]